MRLSICLATLASLAIAIASPASMVLPVGKDVEEGQVVPPECYEVCHRVPASDMCMWCIILTPTRPDDSNKNPTVTGLPIDPAVIEKSRMPPQCAKKCAEDPESKKCIRCLAWVSLAEDKDDRTVDSSIPEIATHATDNVDGNLKASAVEWMTCLETCDLPDDAACRRSCQSVVTPALESRMMTSITREVKQVYPEVKDPEARAVCTYACIMGHCYTCNKEQAVLTTEEAEEAHAAALRALSDLIDGAEGSVSERMGGPIVRQTPVMWPA